MNTPYYEKMRELLQNMSLTPLPECEGINPDTLSAEGSDSRITINLYRSEKAQKAALCSLVVKDRTTIGFCTVFPSEQYILPIFLSKWVETPDRIEHLVDLMPTVDCVVDEPFRKGYLEPMGEFWDKFSHLRGICPEEDDDLRSACSIIYTAANAAVENEGQRLAAFAAHSTYLKKYGEYLDGAVVCDEADKIQEAQRRKDAVSGILRQHIEKIFAESGVLSDEAIKRVITLLT